MRRSVLSFRSQDKDSRGVHAKIMDKNNLKIIMQKCIHYYTYLISISFYFSVTQKVIDSRSLVSTWNFH